MAPFPVAGTEEPPIIMGNDDLMAAIVGPADADLDAEFWQTMIPTYSDEPSEAVALYLHDRETMMNALHMLLPDVPADDLSDYIIAKNDAFMLHCEAMYHVPATRNALDYVTSMAAASSHEERQVIIDAYQETFEEAVSEFGQISWVDGHGNAGCPSSWACNMGHPLQIKEMAKNLSEAGMNNTVYCYNRHGCIYYGPNDNVSEPFLQFEQQKILQEQARRQTIVTAIDELKAELPLHLV